MTDFIEFPFPLRKGQLAYLTIPSDITEKEVEKLYKYMKNLVIGLSKEPGSETYNISLDVK